MLEHSSSIQLYCSLLFVASGLYSNITDSLKPPWPPSLKCELAPNSLSPFLLCSFFRACLYLHIVHILLILLSSLWRRHSFHGNTGCCPICALRCPQFLQSTQYMSNKWIVLWSISSTTHPSWTYSPTLAVPPMGNHYSLPSSGRIPSCHVVSTQMSPPQRAQPYGMWLELQHLFSYYNQNTSYLLLIYFFSSLSQ